MSRPNDYGGVFRRLKVYVDGQVVAGLRPNERVTFDLPVGRHRAHGAMDWARSSDLELDIAEGASVAFEVSLPFSAVWASFTSPKTAVKISQTA